MEFNSKAMSHVRRWVRLAGVVLVTISAAGCHDGPLYGLKVINPYYSGKQWKEDEAYGITDHKRRQELEKLVGSISRLPKARQAYWLQNLEQIMEHDDSADMRRLAVQAAGQLNDPTANEIVRRGLKDENVKVRMFCCQTLGERQDPEATRMLAEAAGTATDQDVRMSAFVALGKHQGSIATDSLKIALEDRDPAIRVVAMQSLRSTTGKNYGDNPEAWIAALQGKEVQEQPVRFAERVAEQAENLIR
ncbi:MAG: HEAT repeat domain-containing protein [Planctomycetaceae bacterium]